MGKAQVGAVPVSLSGVSFACSAASWIATAFTPGSFDPYLWLLAVKQTAAKIERLVGGPFGSVMPALIATRL
jgi:hypothetical protein